MSLSRMILRRLLTRPVRTIAGATLAAVMTGVIINALMLQKSHRSAPPAPPAMASPSAPPAPAATASAEVAPVVVAPPSRPVGLSGAAEAQPARTDPIRDILRGDSGPKEAENKRLILAAQGALIKLGYSVKADGVAGASTQQAIQQYERTHGYIPLGEITPKIVKDLTAAAAAQR
ncbi:MAG TPA: peptidoglycan-binding domain-containing protein [Roseiarcus sp.]|nr:peptidoglycan-binding domain-containing protein [Roseiarcus sp.]